MTSKDVRNAQLKLILVLFAISSQPASAATSFPTLSEHATPTLDQSRPLFVDPNADAAEQARRSSASLAVARQALAIDPIVRGSSTFNSNTGLYTYTYTVVNKPTATNTIWHFALAPIPNPIAVTSPSSAWDWFFGYEERDDALVWAVADGGPTPADWDSVSLWPSSFDIQAGDSAVGFSFTTPAAPSVVSYYVQGFYVTPPTIDEEGFTDPFTLFQNSLTGTIVGPGSAVGVGSSSSSDIVQFSLPIPNPSSGSVSIAFTLPAPAVVRLVLYSVSGQLVRVLRDGPATAGEQAIAWDGLDSSSRRVRPGVYYYQLTVNGKSTGQRRVVVLP